MAVDAMRVVPMTYTCLLALCGRRKPPNAGGVLAVDVGGGPLGLAYGERTPTIASVVGVDDPH